jgi:mRNA m6A methyltransferase catalytic subunit
MEVFKVPEFCIPIRKDVRLVDWDALGKAAQFDVITMDPPWQLAGANPTRGVSISFHFYPPQ